MSSVREEKLQKSGGNGSSEKDADKEEVADGRKIGFCVFSLAVCESVLSFGLCLEFNIIYVCVLVCALMLSRCAATVSYKIQLS